VIFGQDRHELRKAYADAWQKYCDKRAMSPLEAQIAAVIGEHPEYQDAVASSELNRDFTPEGGDTNPFQMIECLAEALWEAQSQNRAPDDRKYLERLRLL
jgi:hypothetical protein